MSMTRRRLLDDTYKQTAVGNPIKVRSVARMRPEITMQGWTEQKKTTGAQLLDISDFETGAVSGTTSYAWLKFQYHLTEGETYTITNNGSTPITLKISYEQGGYSSVSKSNLTGSYSFVMTTHPNNPEGSELAVFIWVRTISELDELIKIVQESNIMLNEGDTALPWEPYTGIQPSPSPEYPQEIVNAGKYNEETQKWEYEITIANEQTDATKNQTVTLTSDRPLTKWDKLTKKNGVWGWEYGSAEIVLDGSEDEAFSIYETPREGKTFAITLNDSVGGYQTSLCDKYRNINGSWSSAHKDKYAIYSDHMNVTNKARYFRPPSTEVETVEQWKTWLSGNPLTLWYQTSSEAFTPLATAEQEAMEALHTYRPTTVLSNQQDCDMTLTYKSRKGMS